MSRLLKEPLLHFLLLGAVLFILSLVVKPSGKVRNEGDQIVVSAARIEQLAAIFTKTWQRPPTTQELKGLIDDFILEEIYYRQALEMGLDRDDVMIRRRLRQKLEFLTDETATLIEAEDETLQTYLEENPDAFREDSRYSFEQIYFSPDRHGDGLDAHVAAQLTALRAGETLASDSQLLPGSFKDSPGSVIDRSFGRGFAAQLDDLKPGEWQGPVQSGLGIHLVRVESMSEGTVPELAKIRPQVEREWAHARRLEARESVNTKLLEQYEVTIEWPEAPDTEEPAEP